MIKKITICLILALSSPLIALADDILYVGDSHSHIRAQSPAEADKRFGNIFFEMQLQRGHTVSYYAACGSAPKDWVNGAKTTCGYTAYANGTFINPTESAYPSITKIYNPDIHSKIFINLGDNMFDWKTIGRKRSASFNAGYFRTSMKAFLEKIPTITKENCFWIGPTYHIEGSIYNKSDNAVDELYRDLEVVLADKCSIIDSRPLVIPTFPNDGLHHTNADSQQWALGVVGTL